jgi:hypothetical protein
VAPALALGGTAALVGLTTHMTVDFPLRNPAVACWVWALAGLVLVSGRLAQAADDAEASAEAGGRAGAQADAAGDSGAGPGAGLGREVGAVVGAERDRETPAVEDLVARRS